jgi:hypothetical protein
VSLSVTAAASSSGGGAFGEFTLLGLAWPGLAWPGRSGRRSDSAANAAPRSRRQSSLHFESA